MSGLPWIVRWLTFVALTVSMVGAYIHFAVRALPVLQSEPPAFLLQPMMAITGVVSLAIFPVLTGLRRRWSRAVALYVGFLLTTVAYGCYLWAVLPDGTPWAILLGLLAGHLYGFPLFLAILVTHLWLARQLLAPNPVRQGAGAP